MLTKQSVKSKPTDSIFESVLNQEVPKLRFYATCHDHTFLMKHESDLNTVTGSLFEKKVDEAPVVEDENEENTKKKGNSVY